MTTTNLRKVKSPNFRRIRISSIFVESQLYAGTTITLPV